MPDISQIIQSGATNPWLFLPLAVLLGALHALEPGHSKSMMAAFIIAVRGTPAQATLLGITAAIGHTLVVWVIAAIGLYLGDNLILGKVEPWLILLSGLLIIGLAFRIFWLLRREIAEDEHHHHGHDHVHHSHHHGGHHHHDHEHDDHVHGDAHAEAHAREIRQRFTGGRHVTNFDIAWFGFTGGLLPCPAAIAVLLICLQLKKFSLGLTMVAGFSLGLAVTLVSVGLVAAWGALAAHARFGGLSGWAERLPYISSGILMLVGLFMTIRGVMEVMAM